MEAEREFGVRLEIVKLRELAHDAYSIGNPWRNPELHALAGLLSAFANCVEIGCNQGLDWVSDGSRVSLQPEEVDYLLEKMVRVFGRFTTLNHDPKTMVRSGLRLTAHLRAIMDLEEQIT